MNIRRGMRHRQINCASTLQLGLFVGCILLLNVLLKDCSSPPDQPILNTVPPSSIGPVVVDSGSVPASKTVDQLWVGDVPSPSSNGQPISLFLNYCSGDLTWLSIFLVGHTMSNTTIISKCGNPIPLGKKMLRRVKQITLPNVGRNDNTIAHVMSTISKDPKSFENHMIVFLKDNLKLHQKAMPRSLTDMLNVASVNGFGCFLKPREGISMYHDTETLQKFNLTLYRPEKTSNDNSNFKSPYSNMGEWLQTTLGGGLRLPSPFTPVCYGGTFAVQASRIAAIPSTIFDQIESSLSRSDNIEEGHFAERMWAGLLSIPPTEGETTIMRKRHKRINFELSKDGGGQLGALMI